MSKVCAYLLSIHLVYIWRTMTEWTREANDRRKWPTVLEGWGGKTVAVSLTSEQRAVGPLCSIVHRSVARYVVAPRSGVPAESVTSTTPQPPCQAGASSCRRPIGGVVGEPGPGGDVAGTGTRLVLHTLPRILRATARTPNGQA